MVETFADCTRYLVGLSSAFLGPVAGPADGPGRCGALRCGAGGVAAAPTRRDRLGDPLVGVLPDRPGKPP
jgi:hypothetical protein